MRDGSSRRGRAPRRRLPGRWAVALAAALLPGAAAAQEASTAVAECAGASNALLAPCRQAWLAVLDGRAAAGLASALGSPVPGSSSTLGRRLGSTPRIALSLRVGGARAPLSPFSAGSGEGGDAPREWIPSLQGTAAFGLFDGFSPAPTVGGLLSVDLVATAGLVFLPDDAGYDEGLVPWGYGLRLGILRESFTLPGITLSAVRRHGGEADAAAGGGAAAPSALAAFDVTTTSVRATVGKDLLALGLVAGVGWDRYAGDAELSVRVPAVGSGPDLLGDASADDLSADRWLAWGGASLTFLVLQASVEAGWARGAERTLSTGAASSGADPGGAFFGSVGLRLTF